MRRALKASLVCFAAALIASAQTSSGSIAGSVVDAQQAAVANATVTLIEPERNAEFIPAHWRPEPVSVLCQDREAGPDIIGHLVGVNCGRSVDRSTQRGHPPPANDETKNPSASH